MQIWGPIMVNGCPQPGTRVIKTDSDWRGDECCDCPDDRNGGSLQGGPKGQITWNKPRGAISFEVAVLTACGATYTIDVQGCDSCDEQAEPGPCDCEVDGDCAEDCFCCDGVCVSGECAPQCSCDFYKKLCYVNKTEIIPGDYPPPNIVGSPPDGAILLSRSGALSADLNLEIEGSYFGEGENLYTYGYWFVCEDGEDENAPGDGPTDWFDETKYGGGFWQLFCDAATANSVGVCAENPAP